MQNQKPVLIHEQRMKLSPQMYQSIQLMALPVQELKLKIQDEVEKNPALDALELNNNLSLDDIPQKTTEEYDYFENSSDSGILSYASSRDNDSKRMFLEGALSRPESLQDHLLRQLSVQPVRNSVFRIGELLIQNLDENGFNIEKPELLAGDYSEEELRETISLIQVLDPPGTCTNDFRDSLIVQAGIKGSIPDYTVEIIDKYFDYLEKGKLREIARILKIPLKKVEDALEYIKTLNPFPGRQFSTETSTYVIPDLMIKVVDDELVIRLNEEEIPVLKINPEFEGLKGDNDKTDKNTVQYINTKIKEANWFIQTIHLRNQTLLKTASAIAA
ncbi:MAG: RNA polymerase sigma-54 factor, partial [Spirochaetia bacterium]|nr:RNA polymerase sigma-54 factor [Spirochaetia bacterium]